MDVNHLKKFLLGIMIDYTHYIKAKSVTDTYLNHIKDLNGTPKKQHFLSRLRLCQGYGHILDDPRRKQSLYEFIRKDLERKLAMTWDEMWDESMSDDEYGYKKEIKKAVTPDIKFYFGMTDLIGEACILLRNGEKLPDGVEKKIYRQTLLRMIEIANADKVMRELEGTTYVNGIGGMICLKNLKQNLVPIDWSIINGCFEGIWKYYLEKCASGEWKKSKNKLHNYIYGLTHCPINLSNFYTNVNAVQNSEIFLDEVIHTKDMLCNIVESQKSSNYIMFNDDTLVEMLLTIKICGGEDATERITALNSLSLRFNSTKLIFREHKRESLKEELLANEHTNILYILNVLF